MTQETVHLKIDKTLNAQDLELLIHELAEKRSTMEPAVPHSREELLRTLGAAVSIEDEPSATAVRLKDGRVRLWMRSRGVGWQGFNLDTQNARTLRDWLIANVDGDSDLFSKQVSHTPQ